MDVEEELKETKETIKKMTEEMGKMRKEMEDIKKTKKALLCPTHLVSDLMSTSQ